MRTNSVGTTAAKLAVAAMIGALVAGGCDTPQRIPRIEPVLHGWPEPYVGLDGLRVHLFNTGTLAVPEAFLFRGGTWFATRDLDVTAAVIEHPTVGLIVFDTGFSERIHSEPNAYLGWLALAVGAFSMAEGQELPNQMRVAGLDPQAVRYVALSHLHFDHAGSIEAFPNAAVVVARSEKLGIAEESGIFASLFNSEDYDEVDDWFEINYDSKEPYATFFAHHDLIGDGSIHLVDLGGHTRGSQGMLVRSADGPVLLTGDAAFVEENWRYGALPLTAADIHLWWEQLWRIKKFVQLVPSTVVVPGHDLESVRRAESQAVVVHDFEPPRT